MNGEFSPSVIAGGMSNLHDRIAELEAENERLLEACKSAKKTITKLYNQVFPRHDIEDSDYLDALEAAIAQASGEEE